MITRIVILGLLFIGCSNPFASKAKSPLLGVWGTQNATASIKSIAFLDNGRYYENNIQVGAYAVILSDVGPAEAGNIVFTSHIVRIDYTDGERVDINVKVTERASLEIKIHVISGNRGPGGDYHKLHSGDGL